jgi:hypothetical protein
MIVVDLSGCASPLAPEHPGARLGRSGQGVIVAFDEELNAATGAQIRDRRAALASLMTDLQYARTPGLRESFGRVGHEKALRDADYSLGFLAEAIAGGDVDSFAGYLTWLDRVLCGAGLAPSVLDAHLECMIEVLETELPGDSAALAVGYVRAGQSGLASSRAVAQT